MNKARELTYLLDGLRRHGAARASRSSTTRRARGRSPRGRPRCARSSPARELDDQTRDDERLFAGRGGHRARGHPGPARAASSSYAGQSPPAGRRSAADDVAVLTYTSGTTGVPKGAMNTHAQHGLQRPDLPRLDGARARRRACSGSPRCSTSPAWSGTWRWRCWRGCPLVLAHRFEPGTSCSTRSASTGRRSPSAAITVFISAGPPRAPSGGPGRRSGRSTPAARRSPRRSRDAFEAATGLYIHNFYGLTETNSPSHGVPLGQRAPVDPSSGALSVGVPVFSTRVRILDEDGSEAPVGEIGEFVTAGSAGRPGLLEQARGDRARRCPAASCTPATSASWTPTAGSTSSTARRT